MALVPPRIAVIDNYDSFTYNLVQALGALGCELVVWRNDAVDVEGVAAARPQAIVLSPGPGRPAGAGVTEEVIRAFAGEVAILGVCLGHQAICEVYGAQIALAGEVVHGKPSEVRHVGNGIYRGLPNPFVAGRYHSLVADPATLPAVLEPVAWTDEVVMGVRHRSLPVEGVQFHPESILTPEGPTLLANFVRALR